MDLAKFSEKAYLDYAMSVILDRALPSIADGLKPVQRRIIYAMSELGLSYLSKHKKSARTVGDVLGKYHPHGDTACYEAMVLMAQDFSYRYPLIDGQGNWGSSDDPKSFAAMRYTESKLSPYAKSLLEDLEEKTVIWQPNFDGSLKEPKLLPARLPNILLNGASGIAVGMSCDIPSHNIFEVVEATIALLKNPNLELEDLIKLIPAPDFPTGAELITPKTELFNIYLNGIGSFKLRAVYKVEKNKIIITELPYQVSGAKIQEQIAKLMLDKKLPYIEDLRDEADENQRVRLVLFLKNNKISADKIMSHLFLHTDLEKSYRVQLNMIGLSQKPQVKNLKTILSEWIEFRIDTYKKKLSSLLEGIAEKLVELEAFLKIFKDLDLTISIIRNEENPELLLMEKFSLSETQANLILNTKLKNIAKLEEEKIIKQEAELQTSKNTLENILNNENLLKNEIIRELKADAKNYGNPRRTKIIEREVAISLDNEDLVVSESATVILSQMGLIRLAKGNQIEGENLTYKNGDKFLLQLSLKTNNSIFLLADDGQCYTLAVNNLPSARGYGEDLSALLNLQNNAKIITATLAKNEANYLAVSEDGAGFIVNYNALNSKTKAGRSLLTSEAKALDLISIDNNIAELLVLDNEANLLIINIAEVPKLNKGRGRALIAISKKEFLKGKKLFKIIPIKYKQSIIFKNGKNKNLFTIYEQNRMEFVKKIGSKGKFIPQIYNALKSQSLKIEVVDNE